MSARYPGRRQLAALAGAAVGLVLSSLAADARAEGDAPARGGGMASALLRVPVVNLQPGGVQERPDIENPDAGDPAAVQRGMDYFTQINCVGCHAANGAGGMGPALSNTKFIYGGEPENIYLTILQGRPNGMPAWGGLLPDQAIWDLVAYIRSISKEPPGPWGQDHLGRTASRSSRCRPSSSHGRALAVHDALQLRPGAVREAEGLAGARDAATRDLEVT